MTDLLSPSPYAYLDDLPPAERQAEIARRQHERREEWCDDARRTRDYQAELAEAGKVFELKSAELERAESGLEKMEELHFALRERIAELEAALEPFAKKGDEFRDDEPDDDLGSDGSGELFLIGHFRRARSALRNR